jgi:hypothetical protein
MSEDTRPGDKSKVSKKFIEKTAKFPHGSSLGKKAKLYDNYSIIL